MTIEIKSKQVIVLCVKKDENDQFKVLKDHEVYGGVLIKLEHSLIAHQQIQMDIAKRTGAKQNHVILVESITPMISVEGEATLLVLAIIPPFVKVNSKQWTLLPEIIRKLPADKTRVPYVKALQILAGGLNDDLSAVEMTQEIIDRLKQDQETQN